MMQQPSPAGGPNAADPRLTSSASWLYWVAALSAINTVIHMSGGSWSFSMGLGLTQILSGVGNATGGLGQTVALGATAVVLVLLCFLGYMACRGAVWAFAVGIVVLSIDTLLLIPFASEMFISIAFHIWAVISLVMGMIEARKIQAGTWTG